MSGITDPSSRVCLAMVPRIGSNDAMAAKGELSRRIIEDLLNEQRSPTPFADRNDADLPLSFPPQLPAGDGRFLPVTNRTLEDIQEFAAILRKNDNSLALSYSDEQLGSAIGRAFGLSFSVIDLDQNDDAIHDQMISAIAVALSSDLAPEQHHEEFVFGCWALTGAGTDDLSIGPVRFERRELWLGREEKLGRISTISSRRVRRSWQHGRIAHRKPSLDAEKERAILSTVAGCDTVCSVVTSGISQKVAESKASLTARLGLTALALSWDTPSRALGRMGLLLDGPIHRKQSISFAPSHMSGLFNRVSRVAGQFVTDEWLPWWLAADWIREPIGRALTSYVQPYSSRQSTNINNAIFLSLWWFHEACREEAALLAIVKFAASLDALAGGRRDQGIQELIAARLSIHPDDPLMTDGRTTKEIVKEIYNDARSRAIHGSTDRFGHDWSKVRGVAEKLARLCLLGSCEWVFDNFGSNDLSALRRSET